MKLTQDQLRLLQAVVSKKQEQCPAISERISDICKDDLPKSSFRELIMSKVPDVRTKQQKYNAAAGSTSGKPIATSKTLGLKSNNAVRSFALGSSQNLSRLTSEATYTASRFVGTDLGKLMIKPVVAKR